MVLLGVDLVKPAFDLVLACDNPLGVTAAFNKHLLVRLNRELGANFDLAAFDHRAVWNAQHSRVEMHPVSRVPQRVLIPGADLAVEFEAGESIWTESSNKYTPPPGSRRSPQDRASACAGNGWTRRWGSP